MEDTFAAMYAKGLHHMLRAEHIIILLLRAHRAKCAFYRLYAKYALGSHTQRSCTHLLSPIYDDDGLRIIHV